MGVNMGHAPDQGLTNHPVDKLNLLQHKKFREHKKQQQRATSENNYKASTNEGRRWKEGARGGTS